MYGFKKKAQYVATQICLLDSDTRSVKNYATNLNCLYFAIGSFIWHFQHLIIIIIIRTEIIAIEYKV